MREVFDMTRRPDDLPEAWHDTYDEPRMAEQWHAEMTSVEMRKAMAATRPPNDMPVPRDRNGARQAIQDLSAKLQVAEAERNTALGHVQAMIDAFEEHVALPDANCACLIAPPCGDCVTYSFAREALSDAHAFLTARQKGGE